ncbi:MAG: BamA/TamA family outer membrane protein, partial [Candidatus Neomarinimicrobiota bacterium]
FNLYLLGEEGERGYITNVTGGAFMPSVNSRGEVLYSLYHDGGYKIAYLANPALLAKDLVGIPVDLRELRPNSPQEGPDMALTSQPYRETMSRPFILPRLMVDYGTLKPGLYLYANEVLDRLLLFGGVSTNSRWDTDYFLLFEFRKFRPTLYAQIYALQRHVRQEFTWYDYQGTDDLRFNLLEAIIGGRMAVGLHRFWLETSLSQYREHIFQRLESLGGGFSFPYYKGASLIARWQLYGRRPEYGGNMFPTKGYEFEMELRAEKNNLAEDFAISKKYSTPVTIYEPNNTLRLTLNFKQYVALHRRSRITAAYEATLGWLSNDAVDTFFYFFGGGPPGLRGYTYYDSTVQGTNLMVHTLTVRIPLFLERHLPLWQLIFQNLSLGFVVQYGDGFNGSWLRKGHKSSMGMEMRLNGHNFYVFPFALAYEVHRPLGGDFKGYRHYVSLLFDF